MKRRRLSRFALLLRTVGFLIGVLASIPAMASAGVPHWREFLQPFLITFDRHDEHAIVWLANHPEYESIEVMVTWRAGRSPLIRAIVIAHDGTQVDHLNDPELASDRAAIFTGRQAVYRPIQLETDEVNGVPTVWLRFTSYQGEDITLYLEGLAPPDPQIGGFIDPGIHAASASLPVMWADASSLAAPVSVVTIDGVPFALGLSAAPNLLGIYTEGFRIGVLRAGHLELRLIFAPHSLTVGQKWLYLDQLWNAHIYEIIAAAGDRLTIRKTTTSPALTEEIIQAQIVNQRIELRSVRATGRAGWSGPIPPAPAGLTLDLSTPGSFSISLDEHAHLVTGTASRQGRGATTGWTLQPVTPDWATNRTVTATVTRQGRLYLLDNEVGEP